MHVGGITPGISAKCEENTHSRFIYSFHSFQVAGRPGSLVITLEYYSLWSLASIPTWRDIDTIAKDAKKGGSTAKSA